MEAVGDGSQFGAKVTYIPQDEPLGLAHCVLIARDFLGDDDFVMYLGDNMLQQGLVEFVGRVRAATRPARPRPRSTARSSPPAAQILLCPVPDPHRFGVAEVDEQGRRRAAGREARGPAVGPGARRRVPVHRRDPRGGRAPSSRRPGRARDHRRDPVAHRPRATACATTRSTAGGSTPARRTRCSSRTAVCSRRSSPGSTATVDADVDDRRTGRRSRPAPTVVTSHIRGPAIIGAGARSSSAPTSARSPRSRADCVMTDSEVEHSVVLERAVIDGVPAAHRLAHRS